jgi:pimeloyl-ACP methyl ester carboxylesterase
MRHLIVFLFLATLLPILHAQDRTMEYPACFLKDCSIYQSDPSVQFLKLSVPKRYDEESITNIEIRGIRLHALSDDKKRNPILFIQGGPGQSVLDKQLISMLINHPFRQDHAIYFFDFRGIGYSDPIACPDIQDKLARIIAQDLTPEQASVLTNGAYQECFDHLRQIGLDFNAYNSASMVRDYESIRLALGIAQWNLWGVSYGTRVAQTYMSDFPEAVRAAILDSPVPVAYRFWGRDQLSYKESLDKLFDYCKKDPECIGKFPDLENKFYRIMNDYRSRPVKISITQVDEPVWVNYQDAHVMLHQMLYYHNFYPIFPWIVESLEKRSEEFLSNVGSTVFSILYGQNSPAQRIIVKADNGSQVSDYVSTTEHPLHEALNFFDNDFRFQQTLSYIDQPGQEKSAFLSDIPTLILTGQFDPITPPFLGNILKQGLPNSFLFEFPGRGHSVSIGSDCSSEVSLAFLNNPFEQPKADCSHTTSKPFGWQSDMYYNPKVAALVTGIAKGSDWKSIGALAIVAINFLWILTVGIKQLFRRKDSTSGEVHLLNLSVRIAGIFAFLYFAGLGWMIVSTVQTNDVMILVGLVPQANTFLYASLVVFVLTGAALFVLIKHIRNISLSFAILNTLSVVGLILTCIVIVQFRLFPF